MKPRDKIRHVFGPNSQQVIGFQVFSSNLYNCETRLKYSARGDTAQCVDLLGF